MSLPIYDGSLTIAQVVSPRRRIYPFRNDNISYYFEQDYQQLFSSFTPLALDTAHGTVTNAYLVEETPLQDVGGGIARWTRVYALIPLARYEYESYAYRFYGLDGAYALNAAIYDREPITLVAGSYVVLQYFLPGMTIPSVMDILNIYGKTRFRVGLLAIGVISETDTISALTTPTVASWYQTLWHTWIVAEDSILRQWKGNIYELQTRYVWAV